ncbi:zinc-ribbon domain-containing protein [Chloroflexota bacterium]
MSSENNKTDSERRFCPYCDEEVRETPVTCCSSCEVTEFYCPECRKPVSREKKECPYCGAEIKGEKA